MTSLDHNDELSKGLVHLMRTAFNISFITSPLWLPAVSHGDFRPPPASFKPMAPIQGGLSKYDYTNTDNALSYKVSPEKSTDNKVRPVFTYGNVARQPYTVYPKKYAHGFCFAVLCCGYTLTDFPISIRLTSLALWQSNDCPSASKAILMNMDKYFMWIHYERLHNHNKAKHNKTVCIFLGIYCIVLLFCILPV